MTTSKVSKGVPMDEQEFNEFFTYYYKTEASDQVAEALEYFINSGMMEQSGTVPFGESHIMPYFFAKIAENNPTVLEEYETIFEKASHEGRIFILKLMEWLHDEYTREFLNSVLQSEEYREERDAIEQTLWVLSSLKKLDIFRAEISSGDDLDLLWTEFVVTGGREAVLRIIDVLEWTDKVREKLREWMKSKPTKQILADFRRKRLVNKLSKMGIYFDDSKADILSTQDLDCFIGMDGCNVSQDKFERFKTLLPFRFSQEDLNHIFVKYSAKWSLGSNAAQHPIVLDTIKSEASKRVGSCRLTLLEILANTYLASDNLEAGFNTLYDSLDPYPLERRKQIENAEAKFRDLLDLPNGELEKKHHSDINTKELISSSLDAIKKVSSYRSRAFLVEDDIKFPPESGIMLQLEYIKPDKFRVSQQAGQDCDDWITLGKEHFRGPLFARRLGSDSLMQQDKKLNYSLLVDSYAEVMKEVYPNSFRVYQSGGQFYIQLAYRGATAEKFRVGFFESTSDDSEMAEVSFTQANIWIDLDSHYIVRIDLVLQETSSEESSPREGRYVQLFTSYNEDIIIVPPAFEVMKMQSTR
jgi:hypothetical protein